MQENIQNPVWEREVLEKTLLASIQEQRRARRWSIFFKLVFLSIILIFVFIAFSDSTTHGPLTPHTAVIVVEGTIEVDFNDAQSINDALRAAFEEKQAQGIILKLNSPGGSPVQSNEVYEEMLRLRHLHPEKKLYAVIGDMCASGCYYIAAGADQIYASPSSLVGSIGVLFDGFGFVDTLDKIGAQRRLFTAGQNKGFMDPFSEVTPEMADSLQKMLDDIHQQFIKAVEQGRGNRLKKNAEIFSGLPWTGHQAVALGLVDGLGSVDYVARDIIGAQTTVEYTIEPSFLQLFSRYVGAHFAHAFRSELYKQQIQ